MSTRAPFLALQTALAVTALLAAACSKRDSRPLLEGPPDDSANQAEAATPPGNSDGAWPLPPDGGGVKTDGGRPDAHPDTAVDAGAPVADGAVDPWWDKAEWKPVSWAPAKCKARTLVDPASMPALPWQPCEGISGCTMLPSTTNPAFDVILGPHDTWRASTRLPDSDQLYAWYDLDMQLLFSLRVQQDCGAYVVVSPHRFCTQVTWRSFEVADEGSVACGDMNDPAFKLVEDVGATLAAVSDELVVLNLLGGGLDLYDMRGDKPSRTTLGALPGGSPATLALVGTDLVALSLVYDGAKYMGKLYASHDLQGWTTLLDPLPQEVRSLSTDGVTLLWTQAAPPTGAEGPPANLALWSAPFTAEPTSLVKTRLRSWPAVWNDRFPLVSGAYVADADFDSARLSELASGKRWTLPVPKSVEYWEWTNVWVSSREVVFNGYNGDQSIPFAVIRFDIEQVAASPAD